MAEESFDAFFHEQSPQVCLFLMRQGATLTDAEDAVQEAMITAYRSWTELRNPQAWVRLVSIRELHRAARRRRTEGSKIKAATWPNIMESTDDDLAVLRSEQRRVTHLLRRLPVKQREVMAWHIDGFKPAEIAGMINQPVATIRSNLRHARATLVKLIAEQHSPEEGGAL